MAFRRVNLARPVLRYKKKKFNKHVTNLRRPVNRICGVLGIKIIDYIMNQKGGSMEMKTKL
jgi:hypothetical protein